MQVDLWKFENEARSQGFQNIAGLLGRGFFVRFGPHIIHPAFTLGFGHFDEFLENKHTLAFMVIRKDTILYERYLNGAKQDTSLTGFSLAKAFVSAGADCPKIRCSTSLLISDPEACE